MKTIHVMKTLNMKTLNKALFAFLLVVPFVLADAARAQAVDPTLATGVPGLVGGDIPQMLGEGTIVKVPFGPSYVQMPDGSTLPLPYADALDRIERT